VPRYLVDGMNVIGCRPDGRWRDLDSAVVRLASELAAWRAATGVEMTVVFDGVPPAGLAAADHGGLVVAFSGRGRPADDEIVRRIGIDRDAGSVRVVTSDRPLAERARAAGAGEVVGAGAFRRLVGG
jgi:predicted RNA-binding protein with PIN domain